MNTYALLKETLDSSHFVLTTYLNDLSDDDLFVRPVPEANHIAWQLGHLISSENSMMSAVKTGQCPELPAGFSDAHSKEASTREGRAGFLSKKEYLDLFAKQRRATLQIIESFSADDLDKPGPEDMRSYAPTIGSVCLLQGTHELMHAGQFAVVRRKLGKPIVM